MTAPARRPVEVVNGPEPVLVSTSCSTQPCPGADGRCTDPVRWTVEAHDDSEPPREVCNRHLVWAVGRVVKIGRRQG